MEEKVKKRKSHKLLKIILCIILLFVAAVSALAIWQRDNINAVIKAQSSTKEQLAEEINASKANTQKEIEKYNIPVKRDFTLEEEEQIRKGTLSVEEAVARIMSENSYTGGDEAGTDDNVSNTEQSDTAEVKGNADNKGNTADNSSDTEAKKALTKEQEIAAKYITQMYALKAEYIGELGAFEKQLKKEYKQQFGSDRSAASISKFIQNNMGRAITMESQCDEKVDKVLTDMRNELEAIGADTTIVQIAEDSYMNEKSLRKSYYLSLYN